MDANGQTQVEYIWLENQPLAVVYTNSSSADIYYIHNDHLSTSQVISDAQGASVWQADYSPFGQASVSASSTITFNLRFPGQYFDAETGLYYNYYRVYDPATGRYIQSDPIGLEGGLNTYGYVNGNPIRNFDPTGLLTIVVSAGVESTVGRGGAASLGGFFDFASNNVGTISTLSKTAGFMADAGLGIDFYKGDYTKLEGESSTMKTCIILVCINVYADGEGRFLGAGFGGYTGSQSYLGGGFSYHENTSYLDSVLNIPKLLNEYNTPAKSEGQCK